MTATAIVPAHNTFPCLARCLDALLSSTPAPDAIVVVNNGSTDDTAAIAAAAGTTDLLLVVADLCAAMIRGRSARVGIPDSAGS